jgi:hypothetical protein
VSWRFRLGTLDQASDAEEDGSGVSWMMIWVLRPGQNAGSAGWSHLFLAEHS